ncbi:MAG TPA: recombinase family protein [Streptosporangiaceae bacterium]
MRLLPVIRLSIETDETTSPERQLDKIQTYARLGDHELVPITEADYDLNVSGSVSPFERPGLGPWLQDDRLEMWDGLCVAKLDRLTRSLFDFVTLVSWLEARGKTLICIDPLLDLSTPAGRAFASITATFAQFERETIAARVRDAWHQLRDSGKYGGGQVPFGYRPSKLDKGWGYEPDPVYGPIVAEIFDRYSRYESLGSLTRWLNDSGVPTPWNVTRLRGKKPAKDTLWKTTSLRKILASPASLGATVRTDGAPVRDEDGVVVYRADALVERDVWERVQARLVANPVSAKINTWPLTQIAFCAVCEDPMYSATAKYGDKTYAYYCCIHSLRRDGKCTARRVKADELEDAVSRELLALVGDRELTESKLIPGRDYSEDIVRVAEQIGHLFSEIQVEALSGIDIREKQATLQRAQEELARLHALKPVQARVEPVATSQTFRQRWESLDAAGRNEFLRSNGVRAVVSREGMPPIVHQEGPLTPTEIPRMAIIDKPELHAVIYLSSLGDMLRQASAMAATVRPS